MTNKKRLAVLLAGMLLLVACGNKGDLYIPDKEQPQKVQASSDG